MMTTADPSSESSQPAADVVRDAACPLCGCVCDDLDLTKIGNRIVRAERACALAEPWFLGAQAAAGPACVIEGEPATVASGVAKAAALLAAARYPLVYGLRHTTCEAQRVAVAIADWIGGTVDTSTSTYHGPLATAFQGVGEVTSSLGEIANRGDLIIFWGANPVESHPRHLSKYSLYPEGMFVPGGRADRTCVVVDVERTPSADEADVFIRIERDRDFEALWALRALAQRIPLDAAQVEADTGVPLAVWQDLAERMRRARFGVILYGMGLSQTRGRHLNSEGVLALVRDLNAVTRFVAKPMRESGNVIGADNVLTWQTGYPFGVNLSRGAPRFNPGEFTAAEMLARGEPDAALIVAADPMTAFDAAARRQLAAIPTVVLDARDTATARAATIAIATATYGIHVPGTVYRMDDVPIPLRTALVSVRPSDVAVLTAIEREVKQRKASARHG
jgi:formylmethanofuran dehydrogenase subunit B